MAKSAWVPLRDELENRFPGYQRTGIPAPLGERLIQIANLRPLLNGNDQTGYRNGLFDDGLLFLERKGREGRVRV